MPASTTTATPKNDEFPGAEVLAEFTVRLGAPAIDCSTDFVPMTLAPCPLGHAENATHALDVNHFPC